MYRRFRELCVIRRKSNNCGEGKGEKDELKRTKIGQKSAYDYLGHILEEIDLNVQRREQVTYALYRYVNISSALGFSR